MLHLPDQINIQITDEISLKPDYLSHPAISGNKYRKLKYNLVEAKKLQKNALLTFGGAFSNHIAAVAAAGAVCGFDTIGVIRGDELANVDANPTLQFAQKQGMRFKYVSRETYKKRHDAAFHKSLEQAFGSVYILPEGGTNALAVKGCEEILTKSDAGFDYICCPVGTGGTVAGLVNSCLPHQKILGFSALKGSFLKDEIIKFAAKDNWELITDYHFGGYAKINTELIGFINRFKARHGIPLDPVYTGKMLYGIFDMVSKGFFPKGAKILAVHTGGLQGIAGMNESLVRSGLPVIE
ncbi:MAG TPA: pyridoxal-phosphate dependent enzyme [Aquaticitalea sp.]|nr:pyridoxal-phosphate dependent enzyme [Aquaticitalea sp.]